MQLGNKGGEVRNQVMGKYPKYEKGEKRDFWQKLGLKRRKLIISTLDLSRTPQVTLRGGRGS